jgi:Zn-dependent peptidase ImmA (M78 family)
MRRTIPRPTCCSKPSRATLPSWSSWACWFRRARRSVPARRWKRWKPPRRQPASFGGTWGWFPGRSGISAERAGLYAFSIDLESDSLDGSYVAVDGAGGTAIVNGGAPTGRRRFTLAHELGHHVLDDKYSDEWILGVGGGERERLINAFAVHFLMPRDAVLGRWRALGGDREPRQAALVLGAEYGLSWTATCAQLCNLGLIDDAGRQRLEHDRPRKADYIEGGVVLRNDLDPPAVPPMFAAAVVRAFRRHKLSAARAVELLRGTVAADELPAEDAVPIESMRSEMDLG